jgi:N-acetylneuraminic acid mutarotase
VSSFQRGWLLVATLAGCGRLAFDPRATPPDGAADAPDAAADASLAVLGPGHWTSTPASPIAPRLWTSAVWSGREFIVYGGAIDYPAYDATNTGGRFDPVAGTWRPTSTIGAPSAHSMQLAWTGTELLAFGGAQKYAAVGVGGRYDPTTDTWRPMSSVGQPSARLYAVTAWIGDRWFVWGGYGGSQLADGFLYAPASDTWTTIATSGAPSARSFASAVWTGTEVIVWGGCDGGMPGCTGIKGDGAAYAPATNTWRPVSATGAPAARDEHAAAWSGHEMIIFGGATGSNASAPVNSGGRYDPSTDRWRPMATANAPSPRAASAAAWLHDKLVVWGSTAQDGDGFLYDPVADQWTSIAQVGAPTGRQRFAFAASDRTLFVWGGYPLADEGAVWTPE